MSEPQSFEERFSVRKLDRCAVHVQPLVPVSMTEEDARAILHASFAATGHRQYVMLMEMESVDSMSAGARTALLSARNVLAAAMLGAGPMDRMLSAPFEGARYPAEYFVSLQDAARWLMLMHDLLCADPVDHELSLTTDLDPFRRRGPDAGPAAAAS